MGAPRTEDWYYCPTCGSQVIVGSDGCLACAAREQVEINPGLPTRNNNVNFANLHVDHSEWIEELSGGKLEKKSWASLIPVVMALVLAVFFVVLFLFLAVPKH